MFNGNISWGVSLSGGLGRIISFPDMPQNIDRDLRIMINEIRSEIRSWCPRGTDVFLSPDGRRMIYDGEVYQKR